MCLAHDVVRDVVLLWECVFHYFLQQVDFHVIQK